ncbi:MAG: murein biosynthesis integral membrane protein MurJ, partial [bacterium]
MSSNSHKIAKAAGILMIAILLSRILGFVREAVMGMQFGSNWMTDAYIAAFTIPDLVYYLLIGGALSAAFIPVFTDYIMQDETEEAWKVASIVMNIVVVALGTIIILGMIFANYLVPVVALNFSGETLQLTIFLTRIMFPAVLFHALNGLAMGVLNSFDHFTVPAFGSVVYNTGIILAIIFLGPHLGIMGMSIGVVLGAAATTLMQYLALRRRGISYYFKIDLHHPGVRKIGSLMLPAVIGLSIVQINLVINQNFASFLSEGSITALRFANRLIQLPYGLFASAIGIAIFPTLTKLAAKDCWDDMTGTLSEGLRLTNFLCIPAGAGLMALSVPIVRLLFEQGKFDEQATY